MKDIENKFKKIKKTNKESLNNLINYYEFKDFENLLVKNIDLDRASYLLFTVSGDNDFKNNFETSIYEKINFSSKDLYVLNDNDENIISLFVFDNTNHFILEEKYDGHHIVDIDKDYNKDYLYIPEYINDNKVISLDNITNKNIKKIFVESKDIYINNELFNNLDNLEEINTPLGHKRYLSVAGVLYTRELDKLIKVPNGTKLNYLKVPYSVSEVESNAITKTKLNSVFFEGPIDKLNDNAINNKELNLYFGEDQEVKNFDLKVNKIVFDANESLIDRKILLEDRLIKVNESHFDNFLVDELLFGEIDLIGDIVNNEESLLENKEALDIVRTDDAAMTFFYEDSEYSEEIKEYQFNLFLDNYDFPNKEVYNFLISKFNLDEIRISLIQFILDTNISRLRFYDDFSKERISLYFDLNDKDNKHLRNLLLRRSIKLVNLLD